MTHFCSMMLILRCILCLATILVLCAPVIQAQDELDGTSGPSSSFTTLSIMRTWTPQERDFPNGGFNLMSSFATDDDRRWWFGMGFRAMGVWERDVLAITLGPTWWFAGDQRLGRTWHGLDTWDHGIRCLLRPNAHLRSCLGSWHCGHMASCTLGESSWYDYWFALLQRGRPHAIWRAGWTYVWWPLNSFDELIYSHGAL